MRTSMKYVAVLSISSILPGSFCFANNGVPDSNRWLEANQALEHAVAADDWHKALSLAESTVKLAKKNKPHKPTDLASSLHKLAVIQQKLGRFTDAEQNYKRSIEIIAAVEGEYSPGLVKALRYMGKLYYQQQDYAESMAVLRRAQHITHRDDGVYTLDQLNIVDWITSIHLRTNSILDADRQQHFYFKINENNFAADDRRMMGPLTKLGDWLRRSGQYPDALKIYRQSMSLLEQHGSDSDPQLIGPLRAISSTLYLQGACCPDEPLDRALNIAVSDPGSDADDRLEALILLADMSLVKKNERKAKELYQQAWHMIASENEVSKKAKALFSAPIRLGISRTDDVVNAFRRALSGNANAKPVILFNEVEVAARMAQFADSENPEREELIGTPLSLCYPQLMNLVKGNNKEQLTDYYMDFDFTVNQDGQVIEVSVVDTNTPVRLGRYVKNMLHKTRFRPRFAEGKAVASKHIAMHQTFTSSGGSDRRDKSPFASSKAAVFQGCQLLAATY